MTTAHATHVFTPDPQFHAKWWFEEEEEKYPTRIYQRPWVYEDSQVAPRRKPGRTMTIRNMPVRTVTGTKKFFPLQVAIMVLPDAVQNSFDYIEVLSPDSQGKMGEKARAKATFEVRRLVDLVRGRKDSYLPTREKTGRVSIEGDSMDLPQAWKISDKGVLYPEF